MTQELDRLIAEACVLAGGAHPCHILGHAWTFYGGRNAGCELGDGCGCSVPVHFCPACGDYDYGENSEASEVRDRCRRLNQ